MSQIFKHPKKSMTTFFFLIQSKIRRPYCNYFLWAYIEEGNERKVVRERELHLQKREEELQKRDEEVQCAREEIQKRGGHPKRVLGLLNDRDELQGQMKNISHAYMLLYVN
ncbi:hypothetical protein I3760_06G060300 [Carya illinoinensis]|nr:hypothetical protein I3760_06G060300 [Carya illinoinensis]KAG2701803.1 hypothetical protein I3760_06G060300 [Carya illinoinensis]